MRGRPPRRRQLTPLELEIMKVIWAAGPSNVRAVRECLPGTPKLAYTTVQTMLNVLVRKGWVKRTLLGRAFEYSARRSLDGAESSAIRDLVDRLFGGSVEKLLMSLVKSGQLDAVKLRALSELVEERRSGAPLKPSRNTGTA